jgi:pimeloyl-ACP methyl ester carboxylesterase
VELPPSGVRVPLSLTGLAFPGRPGQCRLRGISASLSGRCAHPVVPGSADERPQRRAAPDRWVTRIPNASERSAGWCVAGSRGRRSLWAVSGWPGKPRGQPPRHEPGVAEPSICSSRRSSPLIRRPIGGPARCAAPLDAPPGRAADVTICAALGDSAWEAIPSELREILTAGDAAVLAEIRGRGLNLIDVPLVVGPERLARLTVPTLLVSGEDSIAACRFVNAQLTEAIPGAVSVVVPGGHLINPAHPVVMDFITGVLHSSDR